MHGTADCRERAGLSVHRMYKVKEGHPNMVDLIKGDLVQLVIDCVATIAAVSTLPLIRQQIVA
jgi:hypothetical protein